jgi:hypothetical protein
LRYALVVRWPGFEERQTVEVRFGLEQQDVWPSEVPVAQNLSPGTGANPSPGNGLDLISALQPWSEQRRGDVLWSDSPAEPYGDGLDYTGAIGRFDLSGRKHAQLLMDLRWALEPNLDYAWFEASRDGETWTVLTGRHTRCGVSEQGPGFAHYTDASDWVAESLDLSAFDGGVVQLRLRLQSDEAIHAEGVDLKNLRLGSVRDADNSLVEAGFPEAEWALRAFPNPANNVVSLSLSHSGLAVDPLREITAQVLDATGRVVLTQGLPQAENGQTWLLSVSDLAPGIYQVVLSQAYGVVAHTLLAVAGR